MSGKVLSPALLALGGMLGIAVFPTWALCQTEKTVSGQHAPRLYINHAESQATSVGSAVSGKTTSGKTSGEKVTFMDLITVSTFDEVTRLLGKPKNLNSFTYPDGQTSRGHLHYEGMELEYIRYDPNSKYKLRELKITSPDWSLTINETELHPSMEINRLSSAVRQTLDEDFSKAEDALGTVVVAKRGAAKQAKHGGGLEAMRGGAAIYITVNEGTVTEVQFSREL